MGIVRKQTVQNTMVTFAGFAIGAINTLFLYVNIMPPEHYGLVGVVLSLASVLMPVFAFGAANTLVKFYSSFKNTSEQEGFLVFMLVLPFLAILPTALLTFFYYDAIAGVLAKRNEVVGDYLWQILIIALAMAYFEVFYSWARVQLKSAFGNFMKELFCRVGSSVLLVLLYLKIIDLLLFINLLVVVYLLRTLIMKLYAYRIKPIKVRFQLPRNTTEIFTYSILIIVGGSVATILLEIDKVMLNNFLPLENIAFFSVASFMAIAIAVPARAMHQITYPLTAQLLNENKMEELQKLYQKSSLTLFIIAGLLFLLIMLNTDDIFKMLPTGYATGIMIVFWIGLAKVGDAVLGNNNSILYNSKYYKTVLLFGVLLAAATVLLNLWLIPKYGLNGAAIASFIAFIFFDIIKIWYVNNKFNMQPFTKESLKVLGLLIVVGALFYPVQFNFAPFWNIILKGSLLTVVYTALLYKLHISEDVVQVLRRLSQGKTPW